MSVGPRMHELKQINLVRELGSFYRARASSSSRTSNSYQFKMADWFDLLS